MPTSHFESPKRDAPMKVFLDTAEDQDFISRAVMSSTVASHVAVEVAGLSNDVHWPIYDAIYEAIAPYIKIELKNKEKK